MSLVWVNDKFLDSRVPAISVMDRGFLYGDGVFETIRTYGGRPFRLESHLTRLRQSCELIRIDVEIDDARIERMVTELVERNDLTEATIRIAITRGVASQFGFGAEPGLSPTVVIAAAPFVSQPNALYEKGVALITSSIRVTPDESVPALAKTLNAIPYVRAKQEAVSAQAYDGILLTHSGLIAECSSSNIFFVRDGVLYTPSVECDILCGITRDSVFLLAKKQLNLTLNEGRFTKEDLSRAGEVFITNTSIEILPVSQIDQTAIGVGGAGPITRALMDSFKKLTT